MPDFSWWGGARVTPYMRYQLDRLHADLMREFGVGLVANSGIRTAEEQEAIFKARYTRTPNGRYVYDIRYWNGVPWYRISPDGTVATPRTSNHEIQGTRAAVDIADTGSDAGIKAAWSARGRWLRANAWRYDMVASGDGFGEGWHFDINNIFNAVPGQPAGESSIPIVLKEDTTMTEAVRLNGIHFYAIGEEFVSHHRTLEEAQVTRNVNSGTDELHELNSDQFYAYLDGMGIPAYVVNGQNGQVLNPQNKKYEEGGVWSRTREAVGLLGELRDALIPKK